MNERQEVFRVATLNTGSLIEPGWDERRYEIVAWLDRLDADVVCLQETWETPDSPCSAAWIADQCATEWHLAFGGFAFPNVLWPDDSLLFGSTILSRWPIDRSCLVKLPVDETPASSNPTFLLAVELLHVHTNGIDVFSTHLAPPPDQGYHRVRQVHAVDEAIRRCSSNDATQPPVLCGDFNAEPDTDEIKFLKGLATDQEHHPSFQDAWVAAGNETVGWTRDPERNELAERSGQPPKRIDYIFVGSTPQCGAGRVTRCDLAFHEQLTGCHASDHFGLVAEVLHPEAT